MIQVGKKYRHLKTGNTYLVFGLCKIEKDWVDAVLYRRLPGEGPEFLIARPIAEFLDGRFELIED